MECGAPAPLLRSKPNSQSLLGTANSSPRHLTGNQPIRKAQ
jgi:hypothetical protein